MARDTWPASPGTGSAVVIGGCNIDHKSQTLADPVLGTSNPGRSRTSAGGVGRNVAENLARLGVRTRLITAIGVDADGDRLARETAGAGVDLRYSLRTALPTGRYTAVLDARGDLIIAVSAMEATDEITLDVIDRCAGEIASADILVLDCNVPEAALVRAGVIARDSGVRIVADPVSTPKAARMRALVAAGIPIHTMTPNRDELAEVVMAVVGGSRADASDPTSQDAESSDNVGSVHAADLLHRAGVANVWVRLGAEGSYFSRMQAGHVHGESIAAHPSSLVDVTGAGDAMLAGYVAALLAGLDPFVAARYGSAAAAMTVESMLTVNPSINFAEVAARAGSADSFQQ